MKKIYLLLLLAVSLISCSADELARQNIVQGDDTIFVLSSDEELSLVSVRILDEEENTIDSYDYQNVNNVTFPITDGVEMIVYVVDEDEFNYSYQVINSDTSIQLESEEQGEFNHTISFFYQIW